MRLVLRQQAGVGALQAPLVRDRQRPHRVFLLSGEVQRFPARHQHLDLRAGGEQPGDVWRGLDHLLEVVEQQQQPLVQQVIVWRGSVAAARATKKTPSGNSSSASAAACRARRVLPIPPGPVRVTNLVASRPSRPPIASSSRSRPSNGVG
jgi:hypothetical protein